VQAGFREFDSECAMCHGGPGVERAEWATGLTPRPPNLARSARRWDRAELFWIIQNGVKMTGMPAMGEHHSDEDIWAIVAFIETLPETSPEEYEALRAARAHEATPHGH
jgi:mono/diheme cytochrome c family protein